MIISYTTTHAYTVLLVSIKHLQTLRGLINSQQLNPQNLNYY